jgi:hypothetical protein
MSAAKSIAPDIMNIMNPISLRGSDIEKSFTKKTIIVNRMAMISGI